MASFIAEHRAVGPTGFSNYDQNAQWLAQGLQSTGSVVVGHRLSYLEVCENLPRSGSEPLSPALAGGFFYH